MKYLFAFKVAFLVGSLCGEASAGLFTDPDVQMQRNELRHDRKVNRHNRKVHTQDIRHAERMGVFLTPGAAYGSSVYSGAYSSAPRYVPRYGFYRHW